ncbi:MAG: S8 family serine peptidase [Anaerolineae bacterium]|nr:S8 family serine peptidase [Phycisphaerae bacterium]
MQPDVAAGAARAVRVAAVSPKTLEPLERRTLLAGAVASAFDLSNIPVYRPTSTDLADFKHGPMANAGTHLAGLYVDYRRAIKAGREFTANDPALDIRANNKVGITLRIRGYSDKFLRGLKSSYGFEVTAVNTEFSVVQGYVSINSLRELGARKDVAQIAPMIKARTRTQGVANNQGDQTMNADQARANFNVDGTGVKVGVISDSVSQVGGGLTSSVNSGDLPTLVQILTDSAGTDEGRAMLEQIHDIAPGSTLAFATGSGGQQVFANAVTALKNAGAEVIVDDLGYADEPYFQEGVIDTAMRAHVTAGGSFVTAVGNDGISGFEQTTSFFTDNGSILHDFNPAAGPFARDSRMRVTIDTFGTLVLQWDNPYNGLTGSATADLDIRLYQAGSNTVKFSGLDDNIVSGRPLELLSVQPGVYDIEITQAQLAPGATAPTRFKFAGDFGLNTVEHTGNRSSAFGHSVSNAGISVAAVPWFNAPPLSPITPIRTEDFSSHGGGTYVFDASGNRLISPIVTQKPDFAGIDGVNTSFFGDDLPQDLDTLPNFFGTSSAAPNVAAVVALIKQAGPGATQAQIITGLKATARPLNGTAAGVWDPFGGFGLIDANASVPAFAAPPSATVTTISPDPRGTAVSSINVVFNQSVSGVNITDFTLTRSGGANLLTGLQTVTTTDNITYTISNLASITTINGVYTLALKSTGTGITNVIGQALASGSSDSWTKIPPPPVPNKPTGFVVTALSSTSIQLNFKDNNTTENNYTVQRSASSTFGSGLRTFHIAANSTSFLDKALTPGKRYYYRVRAVNTTAPGSYSTTRSAVTLQNGEVVLDNNTSGARAFGVWSLANAGAGFAGANYLQDGNTEKGTKSVRYTPALVATGDYYVYARWTRASSNATNVPFDIFYGPNATLRRTVLLDQRNRGGDGWILVGGPFRLEKNTGAMVRIRNSGTNGTVIADSIRFLSAAPIAATKALNRVAPAPTEQKSANDKDDSTGGSLIDGLL